MEGAPKLEKGWKLDREKIKDGVKRISLAAMVAFGSALPEKVNAMDFPDGVDWGNGAARFEMAAKNEESEYAGLYISLGDSGYWTNFVKGESDYVVPDIHGDAREILSAPTSEKHKHIKVCAAHTHPSHNNEGYLHGPSQADIDFHLHFTQLVEDNLESFKRIAIGTELTVEVIDIVFEEHGVFWYKKLLNGDNQSEYLTAEKKDQENLSDNFDEYREGGVFKEAVETYYDGGKEVINVVEESYADQGIKAKFMRYEDFYKQDSCNVDFNLSQTEPR